MKIEYVYNSKIELTTVYIWRGVELIDVRAIEGKVSPEEQKRITKEIKEEKGEA